eukprot:TRINITY_DN5326_c0_g2_i10.p1 TRINITY_DN5326_c0_g2~~TRINITY_DN5326_c0_g2_i10.p1  ORF type:complete len:417 (+),score=112.51 TRINITY_DN5326_c0_g2_i10:25-1251(+)
MIRRPPRSTPLYSSAASDVYKRQYQRRVHGDLKIVMNTRLFEDIFNWHDEDSLFMLPAHTDSPPPAPYGIINSDSGHFSFEVSDAVEIDSPVPLLSAPTSQEAEGNITGTAKAKNKAKRERKRKGNEGVSSDNRELVEEDKVPSAEEKRFIRAEKNRRFAKQSRERKRKYIQDLEAEVKILKDEVRLCRARLEKYEIIERHNSSIGFELYNTLLKVHKEMQEKGQPFTNGKLFGETFKEAYNQGLEEKQKALKMLVNNILELLMPFPIRISMWIAENDVDIYNPDEIHQMLGRAITREHAKELVEYLQKLYPNKKMQNEIRMMTAASGKRIRGYLKELVGCEKKIELELQNLTKFVNCNTYVCTDPFVMETFAKVVAQLATNPEIRKYGVSAIAENDLGLDALSIGKD